MPDLKLENGDHICFAHAGSGPALFLISGLGGRGDFWAQHVQPLANHFLVVTHDHRGTGASSRSRMQFSIEQMTADVIAIANHLNIERFHAVGHSTGGVIAQTLALDHSNRVNSIGLSASWAGRDSYIDSLFSLRRDILETMGLGAYRRLANIMLKPPIDFVERLGEIAKLDSTIDSYSDDAINISARIRALLAYDRRADLERLRHRCFISCAQDDVIIPPHCSEELHQLIQDSVLKMYKSGGHAYTNVAGQQFTSDLLAFLEA